MVHSMAALLASAALAAAPDPAPSRRVAVLDFSASWAGECAGTAPRDAAQRELCELPRLLADQARAGALTVLRPPAFIVMTRENTAQILKDMGGQCAEGECEVETARLVGASLVLSGEVTLLDGTWVVSSKLHDVATAALLATGSSESRTRLDAFRSVRVETERMLQVAFGAQGGSGLRPPEEQPGATPPPWRAALEVRVGYTPIFFPGVSPQSLEPGAVPVFEGRVHFRIHDAWTLHAGGGAIGATYGTLDAGGSEAARIIYATSPKLGLGAAWWPQGNRRFAVAAELGATLAETTIRYSTGGGSYAETVQKQNAPYVSAELRYDLPLGGSWYGGVRAGLTWVGAGFDHSVTSAGGTFSVEGDYWLFPVSAALSYRF